MAATTATTLRRVQTIVSFSQMDDGSNKQLKFGPTSSVASMPGHKLPRYLFAQSPPPKRAYRRVTSRESIGVVPEDDRPLLTQRSSASLSDDGDLMDYLGSGSGDDAAVVPSSCGTYDGSPPGAYDSNLLNTVVTALWDDCAENGMFRYDLSSCSTKVVPGALDFVVQLNEGRATKKRATEFSVDQVVQPFDDAKFNFTKAYAREVLLQFEPGADEHGPCIEESAVCSSSPNLIIINVSPIEYGHVLLVPRVLDRLPQLVDASTVELALHFAKEADSRSLRVGYNSLGAYATINHLHFQAYYLDAVLPCERAATEPVPGLKRLRGGVQVRRLARYPVNGFVLSLDGPGPGPGALSELAAAVGHACVTMQRSNIPHNLLITEGGRKVFLWPQCFAERQAQGLIPGRLLDTGVNPAVFEIAGHVLLKQQQDYDAADEPSICALLGMASLPEDRFLQVAQLCFGGAGPKGADY